MELGLALAWGHGLHSTTDIASCRLTCRDVKRAIDSTIHTLDPRCNDPESIAKLLHQYPLLHHLALTTASQGLFDRCTSYRSLQQAIQPMVQALQSHASLTSLTVSSKDLQRLGSLKWAHKTIQAAMTPRSSSSRPPKWREVPSAAHQVYWLPDWFASPPGLKKLIIRPPGSSDSTATTLESPPRVVACLWLNPKPWAAKLQHLEVHGIPMQAWLPCGVPQLLQLQVLGLMSCCLNQRATAQLVCELRGCRQLQQLLLSHNDLVQLPDEGWEGLAGLKVLDLSHNQLMSLPAGLSCLTSLTALYLQNNQLCTLPPELAGVSQLQLLDASHNWLSGLAPTPQRLGQLVGSWALLSVLVLSNVSDKRGALALPRELGSCKQLRELVLGSNHQLEWQSLVEVLPECKALEVLNLSSMRGSVPPSIRQLLSTLQSKLAVQWG